jgi:malonyl-CoA/methylmalonyl-CoA synthetase
MSANLYTLFARSFPPDMSKIVIETTDERRYTYAELDRYSARFATHFRRLGLTLGERVAVSVENSPHALFVYLGCLRAGLVYLPLNTAYRPRELAYFIEDAEPRAIVCRPEAAAVVRELAPTAIVETLDARGEGSLVEASRGLPANFTPVERDPDETAAILYTSGTTGTPKGVMLSTRNLAANARTLKHAWGMHSDDVLLHMLPLFHAHGLFVASHCALLSGAKMWLAARFEVGAALRLLPRSTVFMGVPTYYTRLLADSNLDRSVCRNMRLFTCGSAPLAVDTFNRFEERTGHSILERYGMTETMIITSNPLNGPRIAGSVGPALPGVSMRVVDERGWPVSAGIVGQIQVSGDSVFRGYWKQQSKTEEEFTQDGFFNTGDLGRLEQNGYLYLIGRAKDMIISGGYNVYPKELEILINRIEGIAESAVFGVPHSDFGEAVVAVVVREGSNTSPSAPEIIERLKSEVANYKVPKRVMFVDALPRNAMGKVQKDLLSRRYAGLFSEP